MPAMSEVIPGPHDLAACVVRQAPGGFAVEWRDMACPAIVAMLERITGQRAAELLEDQAFTRRRGSC
jgi:hypothetical protein